MIVAAALGACLGVLLTVLCVLVYVRSFFRRNVVVIARSVAQAVAQARPVVRVTTADGQVLAVRTQGFFDALLDELGEP